MWHFVLAHGDLDFHARVVDLAKHLGHATHRLRVHRRGFGQLNRDDLACGRIGHRILRDQDVLPIALVLRSDQPDATFVKQAADDRRLLALDDFEHAAFGASLAVEAHDACLYAITVQHRAHFLLGEIQIGLAIVADHEAVSVAVPLHSAFDLAHEVSADGVWGLVCCLVDDMISGFLNAQVAELVDALVSGTSG